MTAPRPTQVMVQWVVTAARLIPATAWHKAGWGPGIRQPAVSTSELTARPPLTPPRPFSLYTTSLPRRPAGAARGVEHVTDLDRRWLAINCSTTMEPFAGRPQLPTDSLLRSHVVKPRRRFAA